MKLKKSKNEYYVNPDDMWDELSNYYTDDSYISEELGKMIDDIATKLGFLPKFINYCVDVETEALTQRGWLSYDKITKDDKVLSYNDGNLTWSNILDIYINENYEGKMHKLTNEGLDALVTPNHKFILKDIGLTPVEKIRVKDRMVLTGLPESSNTDSIYTDDFVKLVGWVASEGNIVYGKNKHSINIFQKKIDNCESIVSCLTNLNINYKKYIWNKKTNVIGYRLHGEIVNNLLKVVDGKIPSCEFINSLTQSQRMMLIETMVKGDGWIRKNNQTDESDTAWSYSQLDKKHIDNFVMLCTLSGLTTSTHYVENNSEFSKKPYYVVNIYKKPRFDCLCENINFYGGIPGPGGDLRNGKIDNKPTEDYKGVVWCLSTQFGSFMVRRGKYTYLTGNSFKNEMQSDARHKMVKAVCDKNFTLWKTSKCTEINEEFGRKYVIIFNELKQEWDDKKTYLKEWDIVEELDNGAFQITYKNNPFSYFTKVAYHAFVNRIKKEKKIDEVLKKYQEKVYEDMYAIGSGWENIKRHKLEDEENMYMENYDSDDYDDPFYKEENELEVEIKIDDIELSLNDY